VPTVPETSRQRAGGRQHEYARHGRVPAKSEVAGSEVGEQIPAEQQHLEGQHGGVPDRRTATEDREQRASDQRLDDEEQRRAQERRDPEQHRDAGRPLRSVTVAGPGDGPPAERDRRHRVHARSSTWS